MQANNREQQEALDKLKALANRLPAGALNANASGEVKILLARCWALLGGEDQESTFAYKLGRIECLDWNPPCLHFRIERHGGTVMGSKRADIHAWTVDLQAERATWAQDGFRQLQPNAPKLDLAAIVEEITQAVTSGAESASLNWIAPGKVRVLVGNLIPAEGPKQTVQGRRKRFGKALEARLLQMGWRKVPGAAPHTYGK